MPNEHPVGEWDTNVTVCAGNDDIAIINGKLLNEITECTVSSGFVGIQSEGADFEIRRMYLEPLTSSHSEDKFMEAKPGQGLDIRKCKIFLTQARA